MLLIESTHSVLDLLEEKGKGGGIKVRGEFGRVDVTTANGRKYPRPIVEAAIGKLKPELKERKVLGELDHPDSGKGSLFRVSHLITDLYITEEGIVIGEAEIIPGTPGGNIMEALIRAGVNVGVSSRGTGTVKRVNECDEVQDDFALSTYDFVLDPAMRTAYPQVVSEAIEHLEAPATPEAVHAYLKALPEEYQKLVLCEALQGITIEAPELQEVVKPLVEQIEEAKSQKSISEQKLQVLQEECAKLQVSVEGLKAQSVPASAPSDVAYPHPVDPGEGKWMRVFWGPKLLEGENAGMWDVQWLWEDAAGTQRYWSALTKKWLYEEISQRLKGAEEQLSELQTTLTTQVEEQVATKVAESKPGVESSIREQIQKELETDPRNAYARKLLEEIVEKFAPLVVGPHSPLIQELQEKVKAYRDASLKAEIERARLAESLESVQNQLKEARMSILVWESVAAHPKAYVLHDLVGVSLTEEQMKTKLKKLLEMEEFGDQTQAQENLKKAAVLQAVTETQKKWEERLLQVEKEQDAEVALLESQNQEAAKKLNQVSEQSGQLRQELKSLKEERDGLQGKLNSLKENEAQWKKQASDEKTTNDRLKGDMNVLDQQVTLLEAKLSAYAEIMTRTDRLAVGKRIQESRTVEGIQEALRRVAPSLQESAGEATPIVRRSQAPLQEQIEVGPQDPQGIGISPKEFEKLM